MSEQNMKNVRRLLEEVWTQGNLALLPEVMAHDSLCYPMPQFDAVRGCDEYMAFIAVYKGTFLDMSFKIEDQSIFCQGVHHCKSQLPIKPGNKKHRIFETSRS